MIDYDVVIPEDRIRKAVEKKLDEVSYQLGIRFGAHLTSNTFPYTLIVENTHTSRYYPVSSPVALKQSLEKMIYEELSDTEDKVHIMSFTVSLMKKKKSSEPIILVFAAELKEDKEPEE